MQGSTPVAEGPFRYAALPRDAIRAVLRGPHAFDPPLRVLAEDVLGADSTIDLVTVDPAGRIVLVLVADDEQGAALLTRGLAQRAWVIPRLRDWLQLGPGLEISGTAPVVVRLLCPSFSPETRAAAETLSGAIELFVCRPVRNGSETGVLLEPLLPGPAKPIDGRPTSEPPARSPGSRFRSGLSEDDLALSPDEIREFE